MAAAACASFAVPLAYSSSSSGSGGLCWVLEPLHVRASFASVPACVCLRRPVTAGAVLVSYCMLCSHIVRLCMRGYVVLRDATCHECIPAAFCDGWCGCLSKARCHMLCSMQMHVLSCTLCCAALSWAELCFAAPCCAALWCPWQLFSDMHVIALHGNSNTFCS